MNHLILLFAFLDICYRFTQIYTDLTRLLFHAKDMEDSNYETDHCELGRGLKRKWKVRHLDFESNNASDSEIQNSTVKKL